MFYLSLEWTNDLESKQKIVDQLLRKVPNFAPAWKEMAALGIDDSKRLDYLDKGLKADPDLETKGFLLINKALIFANRGRKNEAIPILGALALDPTSPLDIEVIAKKTLSMIVSK
ncbi:tetratricopeptide repeat family [Collimonas arenae]|uniref:Tetratricopeptide repeat family n=1 Tax=Collimonas arenae TaxID=279058 RepID=A0A127PP61_9BURK|nr:tetratricopeptide repeat family [Collimonas arenae]AMP09488.1 tetratricopeptide repeat family [Collimonas arenae]